MTQLYKAVRKGVNYKDKSLLEPLVSCRHTKAGGVVFFSLFRVRGEEMPLPKRRDKFMLDITPLFPPQTV